MTVASAPASAANLGPGFDVLALALDMRCRVTAEPSGTWEVFDGSGERNDSLRAMLWGVAGDANPHTVTVESDIPIGVGLGSSAAVRVAAAAALGSGDRERVFRTATAAEGHPDNIAAAVYGGLVAVGPARQVRRLSIHPSLIVVVGVSREPLSTEEARTALSASVDRQVAVRTGARLAYLIEGLRTADAEALRAVGSDEFHEQERSVLSPITTELIATARTAGALHAAWSGSGPSVIAFTTDTDFDRVENALRGVLGESGEVLIPGVDLEGLVVE
jgi:homoserine kinase